MAIAEVGLMSQTNVHAATIGAADEPRLFDEVSLRGVALRNRIVVSPMCQYSAVDGRAGEHHLVHLGRFAMGGFGLVMIEATAVSRVGRITYGDLGLWDDSQIEPLSKVVSVLHGYGAKVGLQLGHAGHKAATLPPWVPETERPEGATWDIVSCTSQSYRPGWLQPRALTESDLNDVTEEYVAATRRADVAGVDVLEIHLAHGYLLHSFWSPITNTRDDQFGVDREGRSRFPLSVVEAVRKAWPADKPLFVRLSVVDNDETGILLSDSIWLAEQLKHHGVDVVDCSSGGLGGTYAHPMKFGYQTHWTREIRESVDIATMAVGLITDPRQAEEVVRSGTAELVALGREALTSPSWPVHAREVLGDFVPESRFDLLPIASRGWISQRQKVLDTIVRDSAEDPA